MILSRAIEQMTHQHWTPFPDFVIAVLGMFVGPRPKSGIWHGMTGP